MKKAGNRFSTKSLESRLDNSFTPNKPAPTPEKPTPEVSGLGATADKPTPEVSGIKKTIEKTTPDLTPFSATPGKISPDVNALPPTPDKPTPVIPGINLNIEKPTPTPTGPEPTPPKPTAELTSQEPTPEKPTPTIEPLAATPNKTTPEIEPLAPTPEKTTADVSLPEPTIEKPTGEISSLEDTPTKTTPELSSLEDTPEKTTAEVATLEDTPTKVTPELSSLEDTPAKTTPEVSNLAETPEKTTADVSSLEDTPTKTTPEIAALEDTPAKNTPEIAALEDTPAKTTPEVAALSDTPEKTTPEVSGLAATPEKDTPKVIGPEQTPEKTTPDIAGLEQTPEKTTPDVTGLEQTPEKTTADVSALAATPEKTTPEPVPFEATPEKTTPDLGVMTSLEKTTPEPVPFEATPEKTAPDVTGPEQTPEKSTAEVSALAATLEKTAPDPIPFAATPEKTTAQLEVRDGFANLNANGFFTGKASGKGLLTDFTGISGLPTIGTGQFEYNGIQGLGTLTFQDNILNVDANGFTPDKKHLGESDLIGIAGSPGNFTYTIPDGPSPRGSYRFTKENYSRITGEPQSFTTPSGFLVVGAGASGTLTDDGIDSARNNLSSGKSQLLEQYSKFNLRDEAFHRFDGFTSNLGEPYINSQVIANDNVAARSFKGQDGLVRAGIVSRVIRTANDALRIGKFLISPKGLLFIAKNVGMQLTNPKVETAAGIDGGGFFARTTRIYPLGLSTLAQIVANVAPVGTIGLIRHGLGPLETEVNYYENVADEFKKIGGFEVSKNAGAPTGNRLVKLVKDMEVGVGDGGGLNILTDPKSALGAVLGGAGGALSGFFNSKIVGAAQEKFGVLENFIPGIFGGKEIDLLSGIMGPNSIYGIGRTDIRRSTSGIPLGQHSENNGTWAQSKIVITNYEKGVGSLTADIDDTHKGVKSNPNNAVMVSSPNAPYSDKINTEDNDNSIHTSGDNPAANYNDMQTFATDAGGSFIVGGNKYFTEAGYADGQRVGSGDNPAGQNNRDQVVVGRFPLNNEDDLKVDNTKRDTLESSRMARILDENKDDTTPAGLIKYNDLPGEKVEQVVTNFVEKDGTEPYGPTFGNLSSYEVYAYGDIPKDQLPHNAIRDFREDLDNTNKTFQQDSTYSDAKREVEYGQNYGERGVDRSDREVVLKDVTGNEIGDKILLAALNDPGDGKYAQRGDDGAEDLPDLVTLRIAGIQFRAYLKAFSHNVKPEFQNVEYVGRLTDVKLMSKFAVDFTLDFSVAALSARELEAMYFKLNRLAQKSAPTYSGGKPVGPMNRITVGDYFKNQLCFLNTVGFTMNEQSPWDIDPGRQLPYYIDVSIGGDIITSAFDNLLSAGSDFFGAILTDTSDTKWQSGNRA